MRIHSKAVAVLIAALALAPAADAKPRGAPDPFPKAERKAVAEIRRLAGERRYAEADSLARELIARAESGRGARARMLPDALELRAEVLMARSLPNDSVFAAAAERALAARESAAAPDAGKRAASLQRLGIAKLRRVEYAAADSLLARAVAMLESAAPRDERALAVALAWLAEGQRVTKQLARADSTASRAIAALEPFAGDEARMLARAHMTLGNTRAERGDATGAVEALERARAIETARAPMDSASVALVERNLGRAQAIAGQLAQALDAYRRAADLQERALGPDHAELATTLYMLSYQEVAAGDYVAARRTAERALRIRERVFGPEHPQVAVALWQVASPQRELGDAAGAVPLFERSVAILRAARPPAPADLATALSNLGATRLAAGDGRGAREAMSEAIAIREKLFGPARGRGLWAMTRVGQALRLEGKSHEAEALFDTVLAAGRGNPFDVADAREHWGAAAWANGAPERALERFELALAFHDSALGFGSPRTLESLGLRAAARWTLGRRADALADAQRYERHSLDFVRSTARGLSEHEAMSFEARRRAGRDLMLALATDSTGLAPEDRAAVFDAVVRSRLAVLDELADETRAIPRHDPGLAPLVRELEEARGALAGAMVRALRESRPPDSAAAAARARREAAERALAERSASFRAVARRTAAGAADVAGALPRGSVLISYVRYHGPRRILEDGTPAAKNAGATAGYAALLLRAGQLAPAVVALGAAVELEPMVARWNQALATPPPATPQGAMAAQRRCDAIGRAIRAQVWDPVAKHVPDAARIFVVPDGVLHTLNFLALPDTNNLYLAESGPVIHRLTAERDLLPWPDGTRRGEGLLAMGSPDFERAEGGAPAPPRLASADAAGSAIAMRSTVPDSLRVRFTPLPQTGAEVNEIARLWRDAGVGEPVEIVGPAASEAAFKRHAPGRRVLHLATHGFALGGSVAERAPAGTRGVGALGSGERAPRRRASPLLAGLALAGANAPPGADGEDGFLTAEEITALDLAGAEWAVLSACETGWSDPDAAEAVQGLHRAFRRAGVRTIIMSLWAVDDASTRAWMKQLYRARAARKADTAIAVREASRALLDPRRAAGLDTHPFRWAAFVASGDWR